MATVYAVASAKGGVGKTTTTAAVATLLADSGADVVAIDADLGMANLAAAVGVAPGGITLHDVLAGAADPLDAVHEGPAGLRVVPGAADLDAYAAADPSELREAVGAFDDADYVFVDAGAGLSHDSTLPLGLADETLLVSTAERSAVGDTEKTRQLTERLGGSVAGAAITRLDASTAADDAPIDAVEELLDAPVIGRIPEDEAVARAAESAEPLPVFAPDAPSTRAYRDLTRALTGAAIEGPGLDVGGDGAAEDEVPDDEGGEADEADETDEAEELDSDDEADEVDSTDETGADSEAEEDIIVADAEQAGLGEPADEEDIIVAAESPVEGIGEAEPGTPAEDDAAGESPEDANDTEADADAGTEADAVDGETETVGDGHVDGDDLEAMIEEDIDPDQFDDESDSTADGEPTAPESPAESDPDDELAGSVPFRDDDTGTMNTALSETGGDEDGGDGEDDEDDGDSGGGFFSRLLGR